MYPQNVAKGWICMNGHDIYENHPDHEVCIVCLQHKDVPKYNNTLAPKQSTMNNHDDTLAPNVDELWAELKQIENPDVQWILTKHPKVIIDLTRKKRKKDKKKRSKKKRKRMDNIQFKDDLNRKKRKKDKKKRSKKKGSNGKI